MFEPNARVWYQPSKSQELYFAGIIIDVGSLEETYRVKMIAEYFHWISDQALQNRPSQIVPALAETHLTVRGIVIAGFDEGAPEPTDARPVLKQNLNPEKLGREFRENINGVSKVLNWARLVACGEPLARAVVNGKFETAHSLLEDALELELGLTFGTKFTEQLVQQLGGFKVEDKWVFPGEHPAERSKEPDDEEPKPRYDVQRRFVTRCQSDDDGYCDWKNCPQNRDGEPHKSGRHCPLDEMPKDD